MRDSITISNGTVGELLRRAPRSKAATPRRVRWAHSHQWLSQKYRRASRDREPIRPTYVYFTVLLRPGPTARRVQRRREGATVYLYGRVKSLDFTYAYRLISVQYTVVRQVY